MAEDPYLFDDGVDRSALAAENARHLARKGTYEVRDPAARWPESWFVSAWSYQPAPPPQPEIKSPKPRPR